MSSCRVYKNLGTMGGLLKVFGGLLMLETDVHNIFAASILTTVFVICDNITSLSHVLFKVTPTVKCMPLSEERFFFHSQVKL